MPSDRRASTARPRRADSARRRCRRSGSGSPSRSTTTASSRSSTPDPRGRRAPRPARTGRASPRRRGSRARRTAGRGCRAAAAGAGRRAGCETRSPVMQTRSGCRPATHATARSVATRPARRHAEVEVGEVRDPEAVEGGRQPVDLHLEHARAQPAGLEQAVARAGRARGARRGDSDRNAQPRRQAEPVTPPCGHREQTTRMSHHKGGFTGNRRFPASGSARSAAANIAERLATKMVRYAFPPQHLRRQTLSFSITGSTETTCRLNLSSESVRPAATPTSCERWRIGIAKSLPVCFFSFDCQASSER